MWNGYGMGGGGYWAVGMVIFLLLVVAGVVLLARWSTGDFRRGPSPLSGEGGMARDHALELARERFARGEITAEEFGALRRGLER